MASNETVIGRTTRIHGRVTGAVDLEVQGFVEGEIDVGGDVTVDAQGIVGAGIRGRKIVVRGAVRGDLVGEESIVVEAGGRVVGDLSAPRVAIAAGALVRGHVQTAESDARGARASEARASRAQPAARPAVAQPVARPVAPPVARPVAPNVAAEPVARQPLVSVASPKAAPKPVPAMVPRRPPPPVVPALRSAKGQIAKKKER